MIALTVAGFGLSMLGNKRSAPRPTIPEESTANPLLIETPFVLTLSEAAKTITIESASELHHFETSSQTITGSLPVEKGHPSLFIDIEWEDPNPSPRFAKLVLEPAGLPTLKKVFDSNGKLSDVWELHLHE
ncbi:hypothetical protein [Haloferula sp.]|uniref:hypothetical protein n=1 Tax=Haloferula sp. TaxID=2497595 RepID=UPI00329E03A6